jgi:hypothetical protein
MNMGSQNAAGSWMPRSSRGMVAASALGLGTAGVYAVLGAIALTAPQVGDMLPRAASAVSAYVGAVVLDPPHHPRRHAPPVRQPAAVVTASAGAPATNVVHVTRIARSAVFPPPASAKVAAAPNRADARHRRRPGERERHRRYQQDLRGHEHGRHHERGRHQERWRHLDRGRHHDGWRHRERGRHHVHGGRHERGRDHGRDGGRPAHRHDLHRGRRHEPSHRSHVHDGGRRHHGGRRARRHRG